MTTKERTKAYRAFSCIFLLTLAAANAPVPVSAQEGPGSTGAAYLVLPVGGHSISMGEIGAALPQDPFNWLSNPASLGFTGSTGMGIFHSQWMMDTYYDNVVLEHELAYGMHIGVGLTYLSAPEIQGYNDVGARTDPLDNNNLQGIVGLSVAPLKNMRIGANVKYFQERIADWTARGYGMDLGAVFTLPVPKISIGAAVHNLGPNIKFIEREEELPLSVSAGASSRFSIIPQVLGLTVAVEMVRPKHEKPYAALGGGIDIREMVSVRAGYTNDENRIDDAFSAGAGIRILDRLVIDYAWTPYGDLGDFHRISLYYILGN